MREQGVKGKALFANKYILYSVIFGMYAAVHLFVMYKDGRIAFNCTDGQMQFLPALKYIRQLIIDWAMSLTHGVRYTFPMYEWTLAMGDDTIATLNYYGLGNPLYLFSALVSESYLPYFFNFLLYFQIYLGGIAFIALADAHDSGKSAYSYAVGALVYSLSGFTYQSYLYYNFAHAMILIPLMLLGTHRSLAGKKKGMLCTAVFLFALCGFYFLYIGSISVAVYAIYMLIKDRVKTKEAVFKIKDLIAEYIIGIGGASFLFVPAVIGYLNSNRVKILDIRFFGSLTEIGSFFTNLIFPSYDGFSQVLSISAIGVFTLIWIIFSKGNLNKKIMILLMLFCANFLPVSFIMSGGSYYNRWQIVLIIYAAYLTVMFWDEIENLSLIQKAASVAFLLCLGLYGKKMSILDHQRFGIAIRSCVIIVGMAILVLPFFTKIKREKFGRSLMFAIIAMTVIWGWRHLAYDRVLSEIYERETIAELIKDGEEDFYRIENERTAQEPFTAMNLGFDQGFYGLSGYFSILNSNYTRALREWNVNESDDYHTYGLYKRAVLESLSATKYLVLKNEVNMKVPYGYAVINETDDGAWVLCENKNVLPLAYTYKKVFDEDRYSEMNGFEKQQVMMQAAAVEDYHGNINVSSDYVDHIRKNLYNITEIRDAAISANEVFVQRGGMIKLSASLKRDCENYLILRKGNCRFDVAFSDNKYPNDMVAALYDDGTVGVSLGYADWNPVEELTLTFREEGAFNIDDLELCYYDFSGYEENIKELKGGVESVQVYANKIKSKVNVEYGSIVCIAAPYSEGWSAFVDGATANIYKMNDMFMGIEVQKGVHEIELSYVTPGIELGGGISALSLLISILYLIRRKIYATRLKI